MPTLVLYTFAAIGFVCVVGFVVLLCLVIADRALPGVQAQPEPTHRRPRPTDDLAPDPDHHQAG